MCDEYSECCGPKRRFVLGFCIGLAIVATFAVIVVVLAVGYGHIFRPKVAVDDASLSRFAVSTSPPTTTVAYNLTLTLTVRNPNWAMSVTYRSLEAGYLFDGQRFERVAVVPPGGGGYVQGPKKTAVFHLATGSDAAYAALGSAGVQEYRRESGKGVFGIDVALSGEVRYKLHRTWCRIEARCPLELQLASPDSGSVVFQKTNCELLPSSQKGC